MFALRIQVDRGSRNGANRQFGFFANREKGGGQNTSQNAVDVIYGRSRGDLIELGNRRQLLFQGKRSRMKYRKENEDGFSISFGRSSFRNSDPEQAIAHADRQQDE